MLINLQNKAHTYSFSFLLLCVLYCKFYLQDNNKLTLKEVIFMNKYRVRVYLDGKKKPLHDSVMESPYSKLDLHRSLLAMCSGKAVSIRVEEI